MEPKRGDSAEASREAASARTKSEEQQAASDLSRRPSLSRLPIAPHNAPAVSSASGERSTPLPALTPVSTHSAAPTPKPPATWNPQLHLCWVKFPGNHGPVMGWHRTQAPPSPPTFFGCDGDMRPISKEVLAKYIYSNPDGTDPQTQSYAVSAHPRLQATLRNALTDRQVAVSLETGDRAPLLHPYDWRELVRYDSPRALPYTVNCAECNARRFVQRTESIIMEKLPLNHPVRCADLGLECRAKTKQP